MNKDFNSLSLLSGAAILLIGLIIGVVGSGGSQIPMGGLIHNIQESFDAGIAVNGTEFISDSRALSVTSGVFAGKLTVSESTNSTQYLGSATRTGCLVIGDTDGAGVSYCTLLDGTMTCTSTQPGICQ